ncbi:hypothetical protein QZH41_013493, partial [Actinostola sp. cb2023]
DSRQISDEEKLSYLLEMVNTKQNDVKAQYPKANHFQRRNCRTLRDAGYRDHRDTPTELQAPGWELIKDQGILMCKGRVQGHSPTYIQGGLFAEKLINHMHQQTMHLGVASTMAAIREEWYIPKLRCKVKSITNKCPICKLYSTKPYGPTLTSAMPTFRTDIGRPFETTGVDFAGPLQYKITKQDSGGKAYILIFTCATVRIA